VAAAPENGFPSRPEAGSGPRDQPASGQALGRGLAIAAVAAACLVGAWFLRWRGARPRLQRPAAATSPIGSLAPDAPDVSDVPDARQLAARAAGSPRLVDRTAELGVAFRHVSGATGRRYFPETMGAGLVLFDYDRDGDADLFFQQSGPLPGYSGPQDPDGRLYRNDGGRRFVDVTESAGLRGNGRGGYGMGALAADLDGDGFLDLYLTRVGPDRFFRNRGDGTFEDRTAAAGLATAGWSTSACAFDLDRDGDLDLYVARYTDYRADHSNHKPCVIAGYRAYCSPLDYRALPDVLYLNRGDGTFLPAGPELGILDDPTGYGLGVVAADLDDDGWPDLYVANDLGENRLYRNREGRFEEVGLEAGAALSEDGRQQAGMGLVACDLDGDARLDLVCTNYQGEENNVLLNRSEPGALFFVEAAGPSGIARLTRPRLGFGVAVIDLERDGRLDLVFANGHVMDNVARWSETATFRQPLLLCRQVAPVGGLPRFEAAPAKGPLGDLRVWRGLAVADWDLDGDLDIAASVNDGPPALLVAEGTPPGRWLRLKLVGKASNRDAVGARALLKTTDGRIFTQEVQVGNSYLSQSELPLTFGLGEVPTGQVRLSVRWPTGETERYGEVQVDRAYRVVEGGGVRPR